MDNKPATTKTCKRKPVADRLWSKVNKTKGCWEWQGAKSGFGYGVIGVYVNGARKLQKTHRVSWTLKYGDIPDGMCVLHKCDNPKCVNPDHLFLGSYADNVHDCIDKGRFHILKPGAPPPRHLGELNGLSKLTSQQVLDIRNMSKTMTRAEIAKIYSVSRSTVTDIVNRNTWRHI